MKKILLSLSLGLPIVMSAQTTTATIKGTLKNIKEEVPFLFYSYRNGDDVVRDSVPVKDAMYTISAEAEMPLMVNLSIISPAKRGTSNSAASIFVEKGVNTVVSLDSFSNISVTESKANAEFSKLKSGVKPFQKQMRELTANYPQYREANDTAAMRKVEEGYEALQNQMNEEVYGAYVRKNPSSPVALYALGQYAGYDIDVAKIEPLFNSLPSATRSTTAGQRFSKKIAIAKATAIGAIAPEFSQADTSGKMVSLTSFRGKYVLVDFWASWCGPCRVENPNVVAAFDKYKDKNFTVLGVSLDDEERDGQKKWLAAIAKDQLTWTHVSDLKFWDNAVAKQYGIQAIPQNLLLDPSGKIVAKNIRGEELQAKLAELIK